MGSVFYFFNKNVWFYLFRRLFEVNCAPSFQIFKRFFSFDFFFFNLGKLSGYH